MSRGCFLFKPADSNTKVDFFVRCSGTGYASCFVKGASAGEGRAR